MKRTHLAAIEAQTLTNFKHHYRLHPDVGIAIIDAKLSPTAYRLWLYLCLLFPFGDRPVEMPSQSELANHLGVDRRSILRAVAELDKLGVIDVSSWIEHRSSPEQQVRDRLHQELGGLVEVKTAAGRIDLLTDTELIEVKHINDWKAALGQVLAYGGFYPEHRKRIHLFGAIDPLKLIAIQSTCSDLGVVVTTEEDG